MREKPLAKILSPREEIHIVGIGGSGVSGLAGFLREQGFSVTGSEIKKTSPFLKPLDKLGIKITTGPHRAESVPLSAKTVVYSLAIRDNNPELIEAKRRSLNIYSYPKFLGLLSGEFFTVAVAGSHGKSTTTAMIAHIAIRSRLDPTVFIGAQALGKEGRNWRSGRQRKNALMIAEADEWKKALLEYSPNILVVLNIDWEHPDIYSNIEELKRTFKEMIKRVPATGHIIYNGEDSHLCTVVKHAKAKTLNFSEMQPVSRRIARVLPVYGKHNLVDAAAAFWTARTLGIQEKLILRYLGSFKGLRRRLEVRGRVNDVILIDDYAHNPAKVRAALQAVRNQYPKRRVIAVFQPHQALRLRALWREFAKPLSQADLVIVLPIFYVEGRDDFTINSSALTKRLAEEIRGLGTDSLTADNFKAVARIIAEKAPRGSSAVVSLGAGDSWKALAAIKHYGKI